MKNIGKMLKQAQEMQTRMAELQESLGALEVEGTAGGGLVRVTLTGKGEMRRLSIDPALVSGDEGGGAGRPDRRRLQRRQGPRLSSSFRNGWPRSPAGSSCRRASISRM